jgi:hypothetical protein
MVLTEEQRKINRAIINKKYSDNNKEKKAKINKKYRDANKEKIAKINKHYNLDNPKKKNIKIWKHRGVIDDDWDTLYDYYIKETNCMICDKVYNKNNHNDKKCLDHDHDLLDEPNIRYICCNYCNLHVVR